MSPVPAADGTLVDQDVADELDVPVDARVTVATDTARAWGQQRWPTLTTIEVWSDPKRHRGGVLEGCFQYLRRAAPQGMPSYDMPGEVWTLHQDAEQLVGSQPVIA